MVVGRQVRAARPETQDHPRPKPTSAVRIRPGGTWSEVSAAARATRRRVVAVPHHGNDRGEDTLVTVRVADDRTPDAARILTNFPFVDVASREAECHRAGWRRFEETSQPDGQSKRNPVLPARLPRPPEALPRGCGCVAVPGRASRPARTAASQILRATPVCAPAQPRAVSGGGPSGGGLIGGGVSGGVPGVGTSAGRGGAGSGGVISGPGCGGSTMGGCPGSGCGGCAIEILPG